MKKAQRIDRRILGLTWQKWLSLLLALFLFLRLMSGRSMLERVLALNWSALGLEDIFVSELWSASVILLDWFLIGAILVTVLYPFFRKKDNDNRFYRTLDNLLLFFALPVAFFSLINLRGMAYTQSVYGLTRFNVRWLFLIFEMVLTIGICTYHIIKRPKWKMSAEDIGIAMLSIVGILAVTWQGYMPRAIFGAGEFRRWSGFGIWHRQLLYMAFLVPVFVFVLFRNKSFEIKKFVLLVMSLGGLILFSRGHIFLYIITDDFTRIPLHLCNLAMYLIPLAIIFKMPRMFYFTFFINVIGAFIAMVLPEFGDPVAPLFHTSHLVFWVTHWYAFFMPILMVLFGIYERAKFKQFRYAMYGFAGYFFIVLVVNAWFSNYRDGVDYFYLNSDVIVRQLGPWAQNLRYNSTFSFNLGNLYFEFFPLYQTLFFFVYVALGIGIWFLYESGYEIGKQWNYIFPAHRKQKKEYQEWLKGVQEMAQENTSKKSATTMAKEEYADCLKLTDFSKRYSSSKNYAVENANLEVQVGEVFGFLGPNGAGKSTIIKSIVGIQPLTSGTIHICGFDVEKQPVEAKRRIGFVPDHYALYEKLTAREYINYVADLYRVSTEDRDERLNHLAAKFEITHALDQMIETYSHGMKQKTTIMSALIHNPRLWILDEPLTGLDPNSIFQVKEIMREHAAKGNIVFFSSHLIDVVERVCDRIAIIQAGQIKTIEKVSDLTKKSINLEKFYMEQIGEKGAKR